MASQWQRDNEDGPTDLTRKSAHFFKIIMPQALQEGKLVSILQFGFHFSLWKSHGNSWHPLHLFYLWLFYKFTFVDDQVQENLWTWFHVTCSHKSFHFVMRRLLQYNKISHQYRVIFLIASFCHCYMVFAWVFFIQQVSSLNNYENIIIKERLNLFFL